MKQLAWLDFYRGEWNLITNNPTDSIRQWVDRNAAISELADEGWNVTGPFPKKPDTRVKAWGPFQGYALKRVVY